MMSAVSRVSQPAPFQKSQTAVRFGYEVRELKNYSDSSLKIQVGLNETTQKLITNAVTTLAEAIQQVAKALTPVNPAHKDM